MPYDEKAPPRNILAKLDHQTKTLNISWEHNCHLHGQHPHSYLIRVKDLTSNRTFNTEVNATDDAIQHYRFTDIYDTSKYLVNLSSSDFDAKSAELLVYGYQLPSPKWFTIDPVNNTTYKCNWDQVNYTEAS